MEGYTELLRLAVAHGKIAGLVHGDAAHPAIVGVGRVGALLREDGVPPGFWISYQRTPPLPLTATEWFTTSDSCDAEVAIGQAVHQPVGQRVECVGCAGLRNACDLRRTAE